MLDPNFPTEPDVPVHHLAGPGGLRATQATVEHRTGHAGPSRIRMQDAQDSWLQDDGVPTTNPANLLWTAARQRRMTDGRWDL